MFIRKTFKGKVNGISAITVGFKPLDMIVEEEITVYLPDSGKALVRKGTDKHLDSVVMKNGENISDYYEVEYKKPSLAVELPKISVSEKVNKYLKNKGL